MKILLIGANGYIGSFLYQWFVGSGFDVVSMDTCWQPRVVNIDLPMDYSVLTPEHLKSFSHVILLAGHSSVASVGDRLFPAYQNNVSNFVKLVDILDKDQVLLYASTAAIYGSSSKKMKESDQIPNPVGYYDFTKYMIEKVANMYPNKSLIGLRFGTVGGASKNFRIENLLNSLSINAVETGEMTVSNGQNWRAVLGICDLCRAIVCMLSSTPKHRFYNLASYNSTILNVARDIAQISGATLIKNDSMKTNYSFNCCTDRFCEEYGFEFKDDTQSIFKHIRTNLELIKIKVKRDVQEY